LILKGDKEKELGLPFSPLCDRSNTPIAQSQIGKHSYEDLIDIDLHVFISND